MPKAMGAIAVVVSIGLQAVYGQPRGEVVWHRLRGDSDSEHLYRFTIPASTATESSRTVAASLAATEIHRTEVTDGRLVVLGAIDSMANTVSVIDIEMPEKNISFLCWKPVLSPSARYVLFEHFYPRFADPAIQSSVVGVFDTRAPLETPPGGQLVASGYPPANRGTPVYPRTNAQADSFDGSVTPETHLAFLSRDYVAWLDSESGVVFVDRIEGRSGEKQVAVVLVKLGQAGDRPQALLHGLTEAERDHFLKAGLTRLDVDAKASRAQLRLGDGETLVVPMPTVDLR